MTVKAVVAWGLPDGPNNKKNFSKTVNSTQKSETALYKKINPFDHFKKDQTDTYSILRHLTTWCSTQISYSHIHSEVSCDLNKW